MKIDEKDRLKVYLLNARLDATKADLARISADKQTAMVQIQLAEAEESEAVRRYDSIRDGLHELSEELKRKYGITRHDRIDFEQGRIEKGAASDPSLVGIDAVDGVDTDSGVSGLGDIGSAASESASNGSGGCCGGSNCGCSSREGDSARSQTESSSGTTDG